MIGRAHKLFNLSCSSKEIQEKNSESDDIVIITPSTEEDEITLTLNDEALYGEFPKLKVKIENEILKSLTIIIISGSLHNKEGGLFADDNDMGNRDQLSVEVKSKGEIGKLIIKQKIETEYIYSYYGNQDGWSAAEFKVALNPNKIKSFKIHGEGEVKSTIKEYSLIFKI